MIKKILSLLFLSIAVCQAAMTMSSQSHIKVLSGYDILRDNGKILIIADGGILRVSENFQSDDETEFLGVENGFPDIKVAGICKDLRGNYWLASPDGLLTVHNQNFENLAAFNDIALTGSTTLVKISASDKYIYLVTDKVLVRYVFNESIGKYQVKDSNLNAGNIRPITGFGIYNGNIYIFSDALRYISEDASNISDINLWSINSFPTANVINQLKIVGTNFYALTTSGLYSINLGEHSTLPILAGKSISDMQELAETSIKVPNKLPGYYFLDSTGSFYQTNSLTSEPVQLFLQSDGNSKRFYTNGLNFFYTANYNGFKVYNLTDNLHVEPVIQSPNFREISNAIVIDKKIIYAASENVASGNYQNNSWSNLTTSTHSTTFEHRFMDAGNNIILSGTWCGGVWMFRTADGQNNNDSVVIKGKMMFSNEYPVSYGCTKDKTGNFWFANYYQDPLAHAAEPVLIKLAALNQPVDSIASYSTTYNYNEIDIEHITCMIADNKNRLWLASRQDGKSLYMLTQGLNNTVTKIEVSFTAQVYAMAIDQKNILWLGTNDGVKYILLDQITSPNALTTDKIKSASFVTGGQQVFGIHVTENNEKWFATGFGVTILKNNDQEVYYLLPNHEKPNQTLSGSTENIPMINSAVKQILDLPLTNQKLFVFADGFMTYEFAGGSVRTELKEAVTHPAPFLADGTEEVVFYIPDNGTNYDFIKIFDLQGRLVKKINHRFSEGRVGWDGRNDNGDLVSSGIYQFIIYSQASTQDLLRGKMAVVRK